MIGIRFKNGFRVCSYSEQLLFPMFPSILTFDFDLILGLFLTFWGPNGLLLGSMCEVYSCS